MISSFSLLIKSLFTMAFSPFSILEEGLISLLLLIDSKIYGLFANLYNLYIELAQARIFDVGAFDTLINNIYVLVGVVALFILAFSFLQAMINPDDVSKTTKSTKDLILRLALSVMLTCITPVIFDFLYDFQYSILASQVIPKAIIGGGTIEDIKVSVENEDGTNKVYEYDNTDLSKEVLKSNGYSMAFYVLNGFLNPTDKNAEVITDASDYFNGETGAIAGAIGCVVGATGVAIGAVISATGVGAPIGLSLASISAGSAALACGAGVLGGVIVNGTMKAITAKELPWSYASAVAMSNGDFGYITAFTEKVISGEMNYIPIASTIAGVILLYMMFSFCLDLGIRAAKLVVYQVVAPISFLVSVLPSKKDLMSKWFKAVLATWFEIFVRIALVCGVALLVSKFVSSLSFGSLDFIAKAIIVLGLVAFAKQAPKIIGEVTGINAGNLKLGIKEKLAEGGAFAAGAFIGGGLTAGVRNAANAVGNIKNKWGQAKGLRGKAGLIAGGIGSTIAGAGSGAFRAGKSGLKAKNFGDMKGAAISGSTATITARDKRANYKAAHGGTLAGTIIGHAKDLGNTFKNYIFDESIEGLTRESQSMGKITSKYGTFNDTIENLLEKEQSKGGGSVFLGNGFTANQRVQSTYNTFDLAAKKLAEARAAFNNGGTITYTDSNGVTHTNVRADSKVLEDVNGLYIDARDKARDVLMDIALEGSNGASYQALNAKGQAALKDSLVNAESLQATILENANTQVVQDIMGKNGNNALEAIMNGTPLTNKSFEHVDINGNKVKLKDAAKVAQGQADIKIAEMNKEQAAKGDKK